MTTRPETIGEYEEMTLGEYCERSRGAPYQVWIAMRRDGCFGYFRTREEVPTEFEDPQPYDLEPIFGTQRCQENLEGILKRMNSHWKR